MSSRRIIESDDEDEVIATRQETSTLDQDLFGEEDLPVWGSSQSDALCTPSHR